METNEIKNMVDFGNYLLSKKREKTIIHKHNLDKVHDCDIANYLQQQK